MAWKQQTAWTFSLPSSHYGGHAAPSAWWQAVSGTLQPLTWPLQFSASYEQSLLASSAESMVSPVSVFSELYLLSSLPTTQMLHEFTNRKVYNIVVGRGDDS